MKIKVWLISGRMNRESATDTVDTDSILGQVKPKTINFGVHSFPIDAQQLKGQCEASTVCGTQVDKWQLHLKTNRFPRSLRPSQLGK